MKKREKNRENYTIIIAPQRYGKSVATTLSRNKIISSIVILCTITASIIFLAINYTIIYKREHNYLLTIASLEEKNTINRDTIETLKATSETMKAKLEELSLLENKVKEFLKEKDSKEFSLNRGGDIFSFQEDLIGQCDLKEKELGLLLDKAENKLEKESTIPNLFPCSGEITSTFGSRGNPFGGDSYEFHKGLDIANAYGTEIRAAGKGRITFAGYNSGYGNMIIIDHGNGVCSIYGHNSVLLVKEGQTVEKGQLISKMGSTGRSTGPHLHFEIKIKGISVNPVEILKGGN